MKFTTIKSRVCIISKLNFLEAMLISSDAGDYFSLFFNHFQSARPPPRPRPFFGGDGRAAAFCSALYSSINIYSISALQSWQKLFTGFSKLSVSLIDSPIFILAIA